MQQHIKTTDDNIFFFLQTTMSVHDVLTKMSKASLRDNVEKQVQHGTLPHHRHCSSCEKYRTWTSRSEALTVPLSDLKKMKFKPKSVSKSEKCNCDTVNAWVDSVNKSRDSVDIVDSIMFEEKVTSFKSDNSSKSQENTSNDLPADYELLPQPDVVPESSKSFSEWIGWRKDFNAQIVKRTLKNKGQKKPHDVNEVKALGSNAVNKVIQKIKTNGQGSTELEGKTFIMYGIPRIRVENVYTR